jgi:hypothetical protein
MRQQDRYLRCRLYSEPSVRSLRGLSWIGLGKLQGLLLVDPELQIHPGRRLARPGWVQADAGPKHFKRGEYNAVTHPDPAALQVFHATDRRQAMGARRNCDVEDGDASGTGEKSKSPHSRNRQSLPDTAPDFRLLNEALNQP